MILSCNSCEKKFIVPDAAIGSSGRLVQCSSCGNKWRQFPEKKKLRSKDEITQIKAIKQNTTKPLRKKKIKKKISPNLYSPEYLAKKHGIKINEGNAENQKKIEDKKNVKFGFYNSLITLIIIVIFALRSLYFAQDIITQTFPLTEIYIGNLFESIKNIKEIISNFFFNYY